MVLQAIGQDFEIPHLYHMEEKRYSFSEVELKKLITVAKYVGKIESCNWNMIDPISANYRKLEALRKELTDLQTAAQVTNNVVSVEVVELSTAESKSLDT